MKEQVLPLGALARETEARPDSAFQKLMHMAVRREPAELAPKGHRKRAETDPHTDTERRRVQNSADNHMHNMHKHTYTHTRARTDKYSGFGGVSSLGTTALSPNHTDRARVLAAGWRFLGKCVGSQAKLGRVRAKFVGVRAKFGRIRVNLGRLRAKFVRVWSESGQLWPIPRHLGPPWPTLAGAG